MEVEVSAKYSDTLGRLVAPALTRGSPAPSIAVLVGAVCSSCYEKSMLSTAVQGDCDMTRRAMMLVAMLVVAAAAMAQMEMPKPGPEHKRLDIFVGSWSLEGDMKSSSMGPGGKMSETEKCEWMEGGFYLVCHADYKSTMGNGVGLSVMGYSNDDKTYTYREFSSDGEFVDARGAPNGD